MSASITEVREFGDTHWEVIIRQPNGRHYHRIKTKADCPDELAAYTAVLAELNQGANQ